MRKQHRRSPSFSNNHPCTYEICCALHASSSVADPLHATRDGAYWHHDTGLIVPARVGEFIRIGAPQDVAGSADVVAHYATEKGERIAAVVDIYPDDSVLSETTLDATRQSFEKEVGVAEHTTQSPVGVTVPEAPLSITVTKLSDRGSSSNASVHRVLYFIEFDRWRVKLRVSGSATRADFHSVADSFVRDFPWASFGGEAPH
jgi:hypothetical protein